MASGGEKREAEAPNQDAPAKRQKPEEEPDDEAASNAAAPETAAPEPAAPIERPAVAKRARRAQFWYYQDMQGLVQGPFYPGQMSDWFVGEHFLPSQMVAPSFQGEVPQEFHAIEALFELEQAFHCDEDVAWKPPEELPQAEQEYTDEELTAQLKEKLSNHKVKTGPGEAAPQPVLYLILWCLQCLWASGSTIDSRPDMRIIYRNS